MISMVITVTKTSFIYMLFQAQAICIHICYKKLVVTSVADILQYIGASPILTGGTYFSFRSAPVHSKKYCFHNYFSLPFFCAEKNPNFLYLCFCSLYFMRNCKCDINLNITFFCILFILPLRIFI